MMTIYKIYDIKNKEASNSVQDRIQVPKDLEEIQPQGTQVWNYDEVGFDLNDE